MKETTYKKDFFNYVLYHYEFNDRAAVWILNFIKSHPTISQNITFNSNDSNRKLRIAENRTERPTLVFEKGEIITTDGEVIFHELNSNQDSMLYIEFVFSINDDRYNRVKTEEVLKEAEKLEFRINKLEEAVDEALKMKDKALFIELTEELQQIKPGE